MQPARAFAQGIPKTCCLDKLASERGKACAVNKPALLSLVLAQTLTAVLRQQRLNSAEAIPDFEQSLKLLLFNLIT